MSQQRIVIMGAAGRDFHNFNQVYRHNPDVQVVTFTAAQIAGISDRHPTSRKRNDDSSSLTLKVLAGYGQCLQISVALFFIYLDNFG